MAMKSNQMALIKACSFKLDPDTIVLVAEMYHTEKDPATNKVDRKKSEYRYEGRVIKIADLQAEIAAMESAPDAEWKWPNLPQWNMLYCWEDINKRGAKWLADKIKKATDLETGFKVLNGAKRNRNTGDYEIKESCKYDLDGYTFNGQPFTITLDNIKTLKPGDTFSKQIKKI